MTYLVHSKVFRINIIEKNDKNIHAILKGNDILWH